MASNKLTDELKKEIIERFYDYDIEDMLLAAWMPQFIDDFKQKIDLQDFLDFLNKDLSHYIQVPEQLLALLNVHDLVEINLGEGLFATQFRLIDKKIDYACHPSVGIRVISALASKEEEILKFMINDPCYLVRLAVYENSNTPKDLIEYVKPDDTFFRAFHIDEMEELGDDFEEMASFESCSCSPDGLSDYIHEKWNDELLEIPPIAHEFEKRIRFYGNMDFGTQPLPGSLRDYLILDIIDYLKGPIPDQYAVSYAGHGINSYALNFRYALGDLAIMMQVGYGGAYGDLEKDRKLWDECVDRIGNIMLLNPDDRKEGLWRRKYLILFSNFRFDNHLSLLVLKDETWIEVPLVKSWDDLDEYFSFWGKIDDIFKDG